METALLKILCQRTERAMNRDSDRHLCFLHFVPTSGVHSLHLSVTNGVILCYLQITAGVEVFNYTLR